MPQKNEKTLLTLKRAAIALFALASTAPTAMAQRGALPDIAHLSLSVTRAEDIRSVKRLQIFYAQYAQFGLWSQMASLFTDKGEAIYGDDDLKGAAAIRRYYRDKWGNGVEGLPNGGLHTLFDDTPVVNLSADGKTAKGRWHEFGMTGQYGKEAFFTHGIMENEYVKEGAVWKISRIHYYPTFAGPYETGWKNVGPEIKIVPYHYSPTEAGIPIPAIPTNMKLPAATDVSLSSLQKRAAHLNDVDAVSNLLNAYGYYSDRKMWDDAADLLTDDAVYELAEVGIYTGAKSIRHAFERGGPPGLLRGQLNDVPIFDTTVWVSPDGSEARARGVQFPMQGDYNSGNASLKIEVFENRFVKGIDGKWRIREMRVFPVMMTDYYQGWAKSRLSAGPATGSFAPDKPVPDADKGVLTAGVIPVFFENNPVTGKPVMLPKGARVAGNDRLLPAPSAAPALSLPNDSDAALADVTRRLARVTAVDGADNITHAFANYIDDSQWQSESQLFAADGWRSKYAVAFCVGPDHVRRCEQEYDGDPPSPRVTLEIHWLSQPVINVSDDGTTTTMRNRLFRLSTNNTAGGVFNNGIYPDNAAKLVDGVWKLEVMAIDEPYFTSILWEDGWARIGKHPGQRAVIAGNVTGRLPPDQRIKADVPRANMAIRYHGWLPGDTINWPDIKPMWFSYKNPVSGRLPEFYCPDLKTCDKELEQQ